MQFQYCNECHLPLPISEFKIVDVRVENGRKEKRVGVVCKKCVLIGRRNGVLKELSAINASIAGIDQRRDELEKAHRKARTIEERQGLH